MLIKIKNPDNNLIKRKLSGYKIILYLLFIIIIKNYHMFVQAS